MNRFALSRRRTSIAAIASTSLLLGACGSEVSDDDALAITTAFYPLTYLVTEIGAGNVFVTDLTPPGGDAHGVELSPREVADMQSADAVFYVATMSPAIDDAVTSSGAPAVELGQFADLLESDHMHEGEIVAEHHDEENHDGHDHDGHDHGVLDPHFWTDPGRMVLVAQAVTDELVRLDPAHEAEYRAAGETVVAELTALDADFAAALNPAQCELSSFVVTHEAFGYLAHEYGLTQIGIAGIDPELEPSPARIAQIRELTQAAGITTIFTTTDGEAKVAQAVAAETGTVAATLNAAAAAPEQGDYLSIMKDNLAALTESMGCVAP